MKAVIRCSPAFQLDLSDEVVSLLIKKALNHYDKTCASAARQGGFIYGWANCVRMDCKCSATFRELDLTLKVFEVICGDSEKEIKIMSGYSRFISKTLSASNDLMLNAPEIKINY